MLSQPSEEFQAHGRSHSLLHTDNDRARLVDVLSAEFKKKTKRAKIEPHAFICYQDLKGIWNTDRIKTLLSDSHLPPDVLAIIYEQMLIILSVLVHIGARRCLDNFRHRLFYPDTAQPAFTDAKIPLPRNEIKRFLGEEFLCDQFYQHQWKFKPYRLEINEGDSVKVIEEYWRLPFEEVEENIGSGTAGRVDRALISPKYLKNSDGSDYDMVSPSAFH